MGHLYQSHTKKIQETYRKLLELPLSWERAKDWRRQKANRMLKARIKAQEHATITGRVIGTRKNQLTDMESGKFEELVQRICEVMFVRKKAYILCKWYELSDEQKRFYLDLEEQEELPDFQIPKVELEDGALAIPRQSLTEQEELAEGGADDCLSDEDVGADIEEDYDDKPNKQDDDEDTGAWHKREASESSSEEEEEEQLTESDSNEWRAKKPVRAKIIQGLLSSDTEDDDYRDSIEEDDGEVNE
ncbi:hypothetical protein L211DRAFT_853738 [Terfezia boudieri ATCC MYA-4762]|uniref:Uncharacterized protein n=1 Tax=Terfezia boudieri ATCC MYA-4762 TaxID=1051890 RepID=A0A3N4LAT8_9PEZI|nr:hypothetical protein L211DRAFT_853738 [Terfezia boudieri ATCC MYA-4762]